MTDVAAAATRHDASPPRRAPAADPRGLGALVFLLPFLVIFGLFAWFPILRAFVMSVQETNLVAEPTFVGLENFAARAGRPAVRHRRRQHRLVRGAGAGLRLPDPDHPRPCS